MIYFGIHNPYRSKMHESNSAKGGMGKESTQL